jgi:hypothetical protein
MPPVPRRRRRRGRPPCLPLSTSPPFPRRGYGISPRRIDENPPWVVGPPPRCCGHHPTPCGGKHVTPCGGKHVTPCGGKHVTPCDGKHVTPCGGKHVTPCGGKHVTPCDGIRWLMGNGGTWRGAGTGACPCGGGGGGDGDGDGDGAKRGMGVAGGWPWGGTAGDPPHRSWFGTVSLPLLRHLRMSWHSLDSSCGASTLGRLERSCVSRRGRRCTRPRRGSAPGCGSAR